MSDQRRSSREDEATTSELTDGLSAVMADGRRQRLLSELASADGRRTLESLSLGLTAESSDGRSEREDGDVHERVAVALHHCHLPKLADHGLIEYDHQGREARLTAKGRECARQFGQVFGA